MCSLLLFPPSPSTVHSAAHVHMCVCVGVYVCVCPAKLIDFTWEAIIYGMYLIESMSDRIITLLTTVLSLLSG